MSLYEVVEFLAKKNLNIFDVDRCIEQLINIEGIKKSEIIEARNKISENCSFIFERINSKLLSMKDTKVPEHFRINDVAEIFGVTTAAVKTWKKSGALQVEQEKEGYKVLISKMAIDNFVDNYPKYSKKWEEFKK